MSNTAIGIDQDITRYREVPGKRQRGRMASAKGERLRRS